jgi:tripartite-type tricarboxylate transporter receptor subunit TctC
MKIPRRKFLHLAKFLYLATSAVVLPAMPQIAKAQTYPSRAVTMIVPFPTGGTADLLARGTAQALSEALGQPFVVENRAGASGNLAASAVAKSAPDGSSLLFASQAQAAFNKFMFKSLPYDPARDLAPIVLVAKSPVALISGLTAPVSSFASVIDYAKANPGNLSIGHTGIGSMAHVAFELLQQKAGIKLNGVPYRGGAPMVTDLLGGHLPLASDLLSNFIAPAKEGRVRLLAVATAQRLSDIADTPTVQELIHGPFEAAAWFVIMARAGTPAATLQKINAIANSFLHSTKGKALIANQALEAGGGTPVEAAVFIKLETEKWEPVIKAANISLD